MASKGKQMINGSVVLRKKISLDLGSCDAAATAHDVYEILGHKVILQLISSSHGYEGAFMINILNSTEFFLKSLTLAAVDPYHGILHFVCNSWVYLADKYDYDCIFFVNQIQKHSTSCPTSPWMIDRVSEKGKNWKTSINGWDEKFSPLKLKDVLSNAQKAMAQLFSPHLATIGDVTLNKFNSFEDVLKVYEPGAPGYHKYPTTHVVKGDKSGWMSDEEFGREILAGSNPVLPHPDGDQFGPISKVLTPAATGVEYGLWQIVKMFIVINKSRVHHLISRWLHTHALVEPFVLATHRQLNVLYPIYKFLHPHFRDTMHINALARQAIIHGGGIVERIVFPGPHSMELELNYITPQSFS
ncbi:hypothetical protein FXO38_14385 [Capsicum annuum]|nr:hypothetical protein FXO38_14385 [Capsicum annuum]